MGNDLLIGIAGDSGNDVRVMDWYKSMVNQINNVEIGGIGHVLNIGSDKGEVITIGNEADIIYGRGGNDTLHGGNGNDTLIGGSGNDVIYGYANGCFVDGGTGNDIVFGNATFYFEPGMGNC